MTAPYGTLVASLKVQIQDKEGIPQISSGLSSLVSSLGLSMPRRLQHPEGVDAPPGAPSARRPHRLAASALFGAHAGSPGVAFLTGGAAALGSAEESRALIALLGGSLDERPCVHHDELLDAEACAALIRTLTRARRSCRRPRRSTCA